jgi:TetR/AcrR family transcriptional repressor of nem operon
MPVQKTSKTEILHRCWEHFHRHGYHASSISALAQASGLGKAGLLHHFGSKQALMAAVIAFAQVEFKRYVLSVVEEDLPLAQRLEKLLRRQNRLTKIDQRGCFFTNVIMETGQSGVFNSSIQAFYREWQDELSRLLAEYYPPEEADRRAYLLLIEYEGAVTLYKLSGDEAHLEQFVHRSIHPLKSARHGTSSTAP